MNEVDVAGKVAQETRHKKFQNKKSPAHGDFFIFAFIGRSEIGYPRNPS